MLDWDRLDAEKDADEAETLAALLASPPQSSDERAATRAEAEALVRGARRAARRHGVVESFLQEFSLGTREGLALMCLAEALLRTPDEATRDALIAEKIGEADWTAHLGRSDSLFVNASTWGLMLTGKLVEVDEEARRDAPAYVRRLAGRLGEPVIRAAVAQAVRIMGEQFVLGRTIPAALRRARSEDLVCSFDMLGEGARTNADADRYERAYAGALDLVGKASAGKGPEAGHGVSVKLSALCPRYEAAKERLVFEDLYPRLRRLAVIAASHDLNFTIDAEEADRLVLSLRLLERLCGEAALSDWTGLGLAVQAYQKRAPRVIALLDALAASSGRRLMVRLVKGAYWDTEIKRAQVLGRRGYPVFTTKPATDLSYLAAARILIDSAPRLYAQFATHNAHTLAAVRRMAKSRGVVIEHQRLHGMGEALYRAADELFEPLRLRAYAPVGGHEDLLPYLVRRLLENGANTSFVHALLDDRVPAEDVVQDPVDQVAKAPGAHPKIPLPRRLYGDRLNTLGADLSIASERGRLAAAAASGRAAASPPAAGGVTIRSPVNGSIVGVAPDTTLEEARAAFIRARRAQPGWCARGGPARAVILRAMADGLEGSCERLIGLLVREAGKTLADAVSEVREAADFCRYYARLAELQFAGAQELTGPAGEINTLELRGRGVFLCISPWNFPLAIFTGQVTAALAAGDAVVAKPAEQTPLVALEAARIFAASGLPAGCLEVVCGSGETLGARLVSDSDHDGVAFTGGTATAGAINRALAARAGPITPFIAETGGLNAMFVDTTALREQVIDDVVASAFSAAGQRCSALRVLFAPRETADELVAGIAGAMDVLQLGDGADPAVDVGPLIDGEAVQQMNRHLERLRREAKVIKALPAPEGGFFFGPVLAEIPDAGFLEREVFGPILHVVRYDAAGLDGAARTLAARGYGLTLGVHSRIEAFAERIRRLVPAGNLYVNRSIIGAVVGVQPFGGVGLSGTGPKAGGPHALTRFAVEQAVSVNISAQGGDPKLLNL